MAVPYRGQTSESIQQTSKPPPASRPCQQGYLHVHPPKPRGSFGAFFQWTKKCKQRILHMKSGQDFSKNSHFDESAEDDFSLVLTLAGAAERGEISRRSPVCERTGDESSGFNDFGVFCSLLAPPEVSDHGDVSFFRP